MKQTSAKRKRVKKMSASDEIIEPSKRRGRPRVDRQDETAAERRRTQIRVAQRAYRERKESTLEELRRRVSDLTNTLEIMNRAFDDCRGRLLASGLSPSLSNELDGTSLRFQQLMKIVRNPDEDDDPLVFDSGAFDQVAESSRAPVSRALAARNVVTWMDAGVLQNNPDQTVPKQGGMGYTIFDFGDASSSASFRPRDSPFPTNSQEYSTASYPDLTFSSPSAAQYSLNWNSQTQLAEQIELPQTYSFQESSFGRRLHRAALEGAYYLVVNKDRAPENYNRAFQLSLLSRDEKQLAEILKRALARGPGDRLEIGRSVIYIGGAGTHYGRYDRRGVWMPKRQTYNIGKVGQQTLALLESAVQTSQGTDITVEVAGFEGIWFDPYDVEGYLRDRGIFIDPLSSFADVEFLPSQGQSPPTSLSRSMTETPSIEAMDLNLSTFPLEVTAPRYDVTADRNRHNDTGGAMFFPGVGYSDVDTGSWLNFPGAHLGTIRSLDALEDQLRQGSTSQTMDQSSNPSAPDAWQNALLTPNSSRRKAVVDVNKLIKILLSTGVCLGRAPGFRRDDVERALAASMFEV